MGKLQTSLTTSEGWRRGIRRIAFYARGGANALVPWSVARRRSQHLLDAIDRHPQREEICARAAYYMALDAPFDASNGTRIDQISPDASRYFIDFMEHARGFGPERRVHTIFRDNIDVPEVPSFAKSRPLVEGNAMAVLLNLDKLRHFFWTPDPIPFSAKRDAAVWRGLASNETRYHLLRRYYDHPVHDIGHTNGDFEGRPAKARLTHSRQKAFKYFVSIEGGDVATNLKWAMASNMLVMSPKLHFETWFMEGALVPDRHFVLLRDDCSDLDDRIEELRQKPDAAEEIIRNAHAWIARFGDPLVERMVSAEVLRRYFALSGQM